MANLAKRDPFLRDLFAWPRWIDEFDASSSQRGLRIYDNDKNLVVEAVVAGVPANNVDIEIDDGVLTIKAEKREEEEKENESRQSYYQYYYTAALSGGQWDKAEADIEDGVLKINIPKEEAAKRRKISVKAKNK